MNTEINKEWLYEQSPEEVWEYLTQADLIALWLMPNDFKAVAGHEFQLTTKPIPSLDLDGIIQCKIIEILPFQKLIYSWKGRSGDGSFPLDTIVEWTLEPHNKGTKVFLKQRGFKEENIAIFNGMTDGWEKIIQKLGTKLNAKQ